MGSIYYIHKELWIVLGLGAVLSMPIFPKVKEYVMTKFNKNTFIMLMYYTFVLGIFVLGIIFLSQATYNPFIYFRF